MNIKQLKPKTRSWTKQGYLDPRSCKKLFPGLSHEKIIFRSSWERKYAIWCENNKNVRYWGSECIEIPYISYDGEQHKYNPDFVLEMVNGDRYIIEIKPKSQCTRPLNEDSWQWNEYKKNMCKWVAAKKFCEDRHLKFKILTEDTIEKLI